MTAEARQFTTNWSISNLERMVSDGYVYKVFWAVSATDGTYESETYGNIDLERPEELIPFENLTEELIISWVKSTIGDESVRELEENTIRNVEIQGTPVSFASGVPWGTVEEPVVEETPIVEETPVVE